MTGYGVVDAVGRRLTCVDAGCIRPPGVDMAGRLAGIFTSLRAVIAATAPEEVAIEQVFVARSPASALKLGQARGAAIVAAADADVPVFEYAPRAVKQALTGTGAASKGQVAHMIVRLLELSEQPAADAADALALAVCHAHTRTSLARIGAARRRRRR